MMTTPPHSRRMRQTRRPMNLSRDAFRHLAAALGVALLGVSARADWTLKNTEFKELPHLTVNTWSPTEGLSVTNQAGKLETIPTREVLELSSGKAPVAD